MLLTVNQLKRSLSNQRSLWSCCSPNPKCNHFFLVLSAHSNQTFGVYFWALHPSVAHDSLGRRKGRSSKSIQLQCWQDHVQSATWLSCQSNALHSSSLASPFNRRLEGYWTGMRLITRAKYLDVKKRVTWWVH